MISDDKLRNILTTWKEQCGVQKYGRMWVPIQGRAEAYKDLIKTLKDQFGYKYEDFDTMMVKKVKDMSIPPKARGNPDSFWRQTVDEDWILAMQALFPEQFDEILSHDNSNDIVPGTLTKAPLESVSVAAEYVKPIKDAPVVELENPLEIDPEEAAIGKPKDVIDTDFMKTLMGGNDE